MASVKRRYRKGHKPDFRARVATPDGGEDVRCFPTAAEAKAWSDRVEDDIRTGLYVDPRRSAITLNAWLVIYTPSLIDLRHSSRARDLSYIDSQIVPAFGTWPLIRITRSAVQTWVNQLTTRLAPSTVVKMVTILGKILDGAILDNRLSVNVARLVKKPRLDDEEARFLTPGELLDLEDAMPPYWADLVPFMADTGLRIGEVAGLRIRDVDLFHLTVSVREILVEVSKKVSGSDKGYLLGPPKTRAGRRTVPMLTRNTADRLADRWAGLSPSTFAFATPSGTPLLPNGFRHRVWQLAVARAQLADPVIVTVGVLQKSQSRKLTAEQKADRRRHRALVRNVLTGEEARQIFDDRDECEAWAAKTGAEWRVLHPGPSDPAPTPHALRHTAVAHWIAAGVVDQIKLKTWAGHRSIATIDRVYGHLLPSDAGGFRDAMSAMRDAARAARPTRPADVAHLADRRR